MDQVEEKRTAAVKETVAEKFERLDAGGRAHVMGYLMGKEDERKAAEEQHKNAPAPLAVWKAKAAQGVRGRGRFTGNIIPKYPAKVNENKGDSAPMAAL